MRIRKAFTYAIALLVVAALLTFSIAASRIVASAAPPKIEYVDVVVIVLAALSIMITVLGIFIALLGVVGWATFESKLKDTSLDYFREQMARGGSLREEFERLLVQISLEGVERATPEAPPSDADGADNDYVD